MLATAAIVHGAGPPFTYRLGQRPGREIRVNVPKFERRNLIETNTKRQVEADKIAPSMVNDPAPLRDLSERLDRPGRRRRQGRPDRGPPREPARAVDPERREASTILKKATDTPERREDLHTQIAEAFEPLIRDGVLGPNPLPRHEESSRTFSVHALGQDPAEAHLVPRDRVAPERVGKPDGPVYREFVAAFTSPELGPVLFGLVADKLTGTPTLTYEERYTTQQREKAARDASRTSSTPTGAATCWSSRTRRSPRSN